MASSMDAGSAGAAAGAGDATADTARIGTLSRWQTPRNADVVAFCPYPGCTHLLACGGYELLSEEEPARRLGRLTLLSTAAPEALQIVNGADAEAEADGEGVLDCAWLPAEAARTLDSRLLAVASSEGGASLHALKRADGEAAAAAGQPQLQREGWMACPGSGVCMSLDWSRALGAPPRLALTSTAGMCFVGALGPTGLRLSAAWQAHELEGWAVAFGADCPHTLYSGADDAILKRWDLRAACGGGCGSGSDDGGTGAEPAATASNRRSHGAGVCCISPHPSTPHLLATGSYDEKARLWDARQLRAPLGELGCDGGVWRLKWHPGRPRLLLAACMHAGFRVLRCGGAEDSAADEAAESEVPSALSHVAAYEAHGTGKALGYGADWAHGGARRAAQAEAEGEGRGLLGATCSFYDRTMHVWRLEGLESPSP